ncbi:hypothetical protein B0H14DRAFT_3754996 [Mycena olivaceomarginata]|nr:hypothetical protein B0H14DRAFT_3754996 [Mycena olivaceomarginata]
MVREWCWPRDGAPKRRVRHGGCLLWSPTAAARSQGEGDGKHLVTRFLRERWRWGQRRQRSETSGGFFLSGEAFMRKLPVAAARRRKGDALAATARRCFFEAGGGELARDGGQGGTKRLIPQRNSGGNIRTYAWLPVPLSWPEDTGIASMSPADASAYLHANVFSDWPPRLLALLDASAASAASAAEAGGAPCPVRSLFALSSPHAWETFPGGRITIVGDSAHLSFPNGEGANLAMLDGAEMALAIASARDSAMLGRNIAEYVMNDRYLMLTPFSGHPRLCSVGLPELTASADDMGDGPQTAALQQWQIIFMPRRVSLLYAVLPALRMPLSLTTLAFLCHRSFGFSSLFWVALDRVLVGSLFVGVIFP